jgi:hypothetical protein
MHQVKSPDEKSAAGYQVRSMVATELPAERTYSLSSDEFQTMCDGENSKAKSGMWGCTGLLVSGVIGMFSLFENADWPNFWTKQRGTLLVYFGVLLLISGGALVGFLICLYKLVKEDTSYSRLKKRIEKHFTNTPLPSAEAGSQIEIPPVEGP